MAAAAADDGEPPAALLALVAPHIDSFDYFLNEGLQRVEEALLPTEVTHPGTGARLSIWLESLRVGKPMREESRATESMREMRVFPRECRQAGTSYTAPLLARVCWEVEGGDGLQSKEVRLSDVPVMVRSAACNLHASTRQQLVQRGEEINEMGGYFIVNGIERIIRLLINQRRHYIMGMVRGAYSRRGANFTEFATAIRCVAADESSGSVRAHYMTNGSARVAFVLRRQEFFIPAGIVLKALIETTDREIFEKVVASTDSTFSAERVEVLLRETAQLGVRTRAQCLVHLGKHFRAVLDAPASRDDMAVGEQLLRELIFVHLERGADKFALLILMLRKLYALASGKCQGDNPDSLMHQEVLLPGHLLQQFFKEHLQDWQTRLKELFLKEAQDKPSVNFEEAALVEKCVTKACGYVDVGKRMTYLLSTGNLASRTGMGQTQKSGFTIVAEKLNFLRYLSHFRSVHRGAYFQELRTTTVRKLLPDSWGFMCPVHTPDGSPCGLLNHLAAPCQLVVDVAEDPSATAQGVCTVLARAGMVPASPALTLPSTPQHVPVMLDGAVVGSVRADGAAALVLAVRRYKAQAGELDHVRYLEAAHIPVSDAGAYPGLYMFSSPARFMRPVRQLGTSGLVAGTIELIGSLEQAYMDIRCPDGGTCGSATLAATHEECHATAFLSAVASFTPWSDFNQSPRNMYQCQMAKQTMGTPLDSYPFRSDTKLYRLHTPQKPIAQTQGYQKYHVNEYPLGTNAVVAVLAHTGYDMEDAMIINKSALDRGFAHGSLIKTETVDLSERRGVAKMKFGRGTSTARDKGRDDSALGPDGLPRLGARLTKGGAVYSVVDETTGIEKVTQHKNEDAAYVDQVTVLGGANDKSVQKVCVKTVYNRNPVIGDKFSSRHGQKGVLSFQWPDEDMPFVARTGIRPDIIINPHAFPSRMTIGMLVESLASKAGALDGKFVDATPFAASTAGEAYESPAQLFGEALAAHGFSRQGGETMISGTSGIELKVDIFIGPVYYQRLRHQVSDKFQVRSVGPVNQLTHQPIKGRKMGGGIRFGEMERDALLAHGAAYLLQDRLHLCSDRHVTDVCTRCGGMLAVMSRAGTSGRPVCRVCATGSHVERCALPKVLAFLAAELAACGIRLKLHVE